MFKNILTVNNMNKISIKIQKNRGKLFPMQNILKTHILIYIKFCI